MYIFQLVGKGISTPCTEHDTQGRYIEEIVDQTLDEKIATAVLDMYPTVISFSSAYSQLGSFFFCLGLDLAFNTKTLNSKQ